MSRVHIRAGDRFGTLTCVEVNGCTPDGHRIWTCKCDCGADADKATNALRSSTRLKSQISCGCLTAITNSAAHKKHGMHGTSAYSSWNAMKQRCLNPHDKDYARYGGSGIGVEGDWVTSFEQFYEHIGPKPPGTTVDRIDNTKGYVVDNVRWATDSAQQNNKKLSVLWVILGGGFETLNDAAKHYGVSVQTIHKWVRGYEDKRRGTYAPPKERCYAIPIY